MRRRAITATAHQLVRSALRGLVVEAIRLGDATEDRVEQSAEGRADEPRVVPELVELALALLEALPHRDTLVVDLIGHRTAALVGDRLCPRKCRTDRPVAAVPTDSSVSSTRA